MAWLDWDGDQPKLRPVSRADHQVFTGGKLAVEVEKERSGTRSEGSTICMELRGVWSKPFACIRGIGLCVVKSE